MAGEKIRVLLLVDTLKGGGVEEWVSEIARLIDREAFEVTVCYLTDIRYRDDFSYADIIRGYGCEVEYIGFFPGGGRLTTERLKSHLHSKSRVRKILQYLYLPLSLMHLPSLYRLVRRKKINVIHAFMHYSFILAAITGKMRGVPVVYQVTESRAQLREGRPQWIFRAMRILHPVVGTFFTGLSAKELVEYGGVPVEKIKAIAGAIDVADAVSVEPANNPVIEEFSLLLKGAFPVLLSVGRFTPEKGHLYAVGVIKEVLKSFPMGRLIILGDGWEYGMIKQAVLKEGLGSSVIMPGFRADLKNFYSAADIYLRTTLVENCTLSSYRAMAFGLPVVGFQNDGAECIIEGKTGILVPSGDLGKMAAEVVKLTKDRDLMSHLGKEAAAYVSENLDIRKAIRDFEAEYKRLIAT